jgi:3-dehydroquinate synthase
LVARAKLPVVAPDRGIDNWLEYMGHDKKVESGKLRFVLLKRLGEAVVTGELKADALTQTIAASVQG